MEIYYVDTFACFKKNFFNVQIQISLILPFPLNGYNTTDQYQLKNIPLFY